MKYKYNLCYNTEQWYNGISDAEARANVMAHDKKYYNVDIELNVDIQGVSEKQAAYAENLLTAKLNDIIGGAVDMFRRIVVDRDKRLDGAFEQVGVDSFSELVKRLALNESVCGVPMSDIIKMNAHDIIELLK